jgi:hypothetical protein
MGFQNPELEAPPAPPRGELGKSERAVHEMDAPSRGELQSEQVVHKMDGE